MATRTLNVVISGDAKGVDKATRQVQGSFDRMGKSGSKTLSHLRTGFLALGAAAAGGAALGLKKSAEAAIESEKANARLQAQLRALGISYAAHEKQIQRVIDRHSQLSGFDDEDLGDSFTNIVRVVGDVNRALDLNVIAMDFARARSMDLAKAGELIGKVAGGNVGVLSRYGIALKPVTDASDALAKKTGEVTVEQRRAAAEADKQATAQKALGLLQERFAGQAKAYGDTTAGANDRARVAFENLGETIGARVTPIIARVAEGFNTLVRQITLGQGPGGRIRAVFERIAGEAVNLAGTIRGLVQWFQRHRTATTVLLSVVAGLSAAFVAYKVATIAAAVATKTMAVATAALNVVLRANPIGLVVTALIALGTGLVVAYKRSETFRRIVDGAWSAVKSAASSAWRVIKPVLQGIASGATAVYNAMKRVAGIFGSVKGAVSDAAGFLNPFGDGLGKMAGDITGLGGTGGLMGADPDLAPFAAVGRRFGLGVTSGIRPGAVTTTGNRSYHASGDAIDMAGSPSGMLRFFQFARQSFGGRLRELIYTPGGVGIKDGRPYTYSGQVARDHFDHVHLAFTGPFGDGIGQAASAARRAGFRGNDLITAVAIAGAESGYRNRARLHTGSEDSRGMWQINTLAHPWATNLYDAEANARAAYRVFREAGGFSPWSVFSSGRYRGFLARARAAVAGGGGRGGGGGNTAVGGGGGRGSVEGGPGNTASGIGDTGKDMGALSGPGGALGMEGQLARVGVRRAKAESRDDLSGLIKTLVDERKIKRRRLKAIRKVLRGRITKERRVRLLQEEATLIGEIGDLTESIKEYRADRAGGATTISRADELEAGVDTSVDTGGDDAGGGAPDNSALVAAQEEANRIQQQLLDYQRETRDSQLRTEALVRTQQPALQNALIALVNGSIGGRVGLGFQGLRSPAGSVAGF